MSFGDWLGKYLGEWVGYSSSGSSSDVTISCAKGNATASGLQASITVSGGATTITCGIGQATASGLTATISDGSADPRLDAILALLTGKKVYDAGTGLWRVYAPDNTELADESGVLMRGLHGWMLTEGSAEGAFSNWLILARRRARR